jgi:hypothetical protein
MLLETLGGSAAFGVKAATDETLQASTVGAGRP